MQSEGKCKSRDSGQIKSSDNAERGRLEQRVMHSDGQHKLVGSVKAACIASLPADRKDCTSKICKSTTNCCQFFRSMTQVKIAERSLFVAAITTIKLNAEPAG